MKLAMKLFLFVAALLFTIPALAQDSAQAELKLGYDLRGQGRCVEAVPHLEASERLHPQARTILNLSDCEIQLHQWDAAEVHAVVGMQRAQHENNVDLVRIADAQLASLPIHPDPLVAMPPLPVSAPLPDVPVRTTEKKVRAKIIVGALAGGGVLGLGLGAAYGLEALAKNRDSNTNNQCNATGCNSTGFALRSQARTDALISNVAFGLGIASIIAGGITLKVVW